MKNLILFILLTLSIHANACRPNLNPIKLNIEQATDVQVGFVTGIRDVSYEDSLKYSDGEIIIIPGHREMRIFLTQRIKGNAKINEAIVAGGTFCGNFYDIHEKVYVFNRLDSELLFALSEDDLMNIHHDIYIEFSNKAVNVESATKTPLELH